MKAVVTGQHVVEWVATRTKEFGNYGAAVGIGLEHNGRLIAGVVVNEFNGVNACIHVAANGAGWLNREFLWFVFHYCFEQAKLNRLTGLVVESNIDARKFDEHLGFVEETRLKNAHKDGDIIVYVMWKESCKWLSIKKQKIGSSKNSQNANRDVGYGTQVKQENNEGSAMEHFS